MILANIRTDELPLLAGMKVMRRMLLHGGADADLTGVVLPRLVDEAAALVVERKPRDVDGAVGHGLLVHRPPDTRPVRLELHVRRLRRYVASTLLFSADTAYNIDQGPDSQKVLGG